MNRYVPTLVLAAAQTFAGIMAMAGAHLAPRNTLFGIRVPDGFRAGTEGRRAIVRFRTILGIPWLLGLAAILLAPTSRLAAVMLGAPVALVIGAVAGYLVEHRRLLPFAVPETQTREIELTLEPDRLPWFMWLWPGPLLMLAAAALYLNAHWDQIPQRFPVHWGLDGRPNGWSVKNVRGVYTSLFLGGEVVIWMLVTALAVWYGARRSAMRRPLAAFMIAIAYAIAGIFSDVLLLPLYRANPALVFAPLLLIVPGVIYLLKKFNEPRDPPDPTPPECWKAGFFYYNPNDAALMVEQRGGAGLTLNFANPWCWVLCGFFVANLATMFVLARVFS